MICKTLVIGVWSLGVLVAPSALLAQDYARPAPSPAEVEKSIVASTNQFRSRNLRDPVRVNDRLTRTARDYAAYLARTDQFSHTADGREPWDRAREHGYDYCTILENIAYQFSSAGFGVRELGNAFMSSWEHS